MTEKDILSAEEKAQRQIEEVIDEAMQEAEKIRYNAYTYASFILEQLEKMTTGSLALIHGGKDRIENLRQQIKLGYAENASLPVQEVIETKVDEKVTEEQKELTFKENFNAYIENISTRKNR